MNQESRVLTISNLSLSFEGLRVLHNVNLSVKECQIKAIIGPNGAGKTTLFNILTGLYRPDGGHITFYGNRIDGLPSHQIARMNISRTFQTIRLFGRMQVIENVMVGLHVYRNVNLLKTMIGSKALAQEESSFRTQALEILRTVGLEKHAEEAAVNLPYGLQKKLEIARALANKPKLLLLDEPAGGLNRSESEGLAKLILEIRKMGITILLIEHDMTVVMNLADEIMVLNYGTVIADGPPREIQTNDKVIEAYLGKKEDGS